MNSDSNTNVDAGEDASSEKELLSHSKRLIALVSIPAALLLVGYLLLPSDHGAVSTKSVVLFIVGVSALTGITVGMAVRDVAGTMHMRPQMRLLVLVLIIVGSICFFAISYSRLSDVPGQMVGVVTGLDAVYFTVSTSLTVGFGDVYASGQLGRFEVLVQMVFTVVVLATAARLLTGILRRTAVEKRRARS